MSRSAWRQPARIADAISGAFERLGLDARFRQSEVWSIWPTVVGPQIARHAQPYAVIHGRLIVHVTDPVWLHHLSMMRLKVVAALNQKLRVTTVRELVLRVGEVAAPPVTLPGPPRPIQEPPVAPEEAARVDALLAPLGDIPSRDALRRLLLRALREREPSW